MAPTPKRKLSDAQVKALDHDEDGAAGGSKVRALGEHELAGLFAEAYEAYDYQAERVRFDTLNRKWWFGPDRRGNDSVLLLKLTRLEDEREDTIPTPVLASELGRPMVEDVVRALNKALS